MGCIETESDMVNEGQFNRTGIRIVKKSEAEALEVPSNGSPIAYLHFVDGDGNTLVPEYVPDGLATYAGQLSGAKYTIVSTADLAALEARVAALEAEVVSIAATPSTVAKRNIDGELVAVNFRGDMRALDDSDTIQLKTNDNQVVFLAGKSAGDPALRFFGAGAPALRVTLAASSPTLAGDLAAALQGYGLIDLTP